MVDEVATLLCGLNPELGEKSLLKITAIHACPNVLREQWRRKTWRAPLGTTIFIRWAFHNGFIQDDHITSSVVGDKIPKHWLKAYKRARNK